MEHFCSHTGLKPPLLLVGGTFVEDSFKRFSEEGTPVRPCVDGGGLPPT